MRKWKRAVRPAPPGVECALIPLFKRPFCPRAVETSGAKLPLSEPERAEGRRRETLPARDAPRLLPGGPGDMASWKPMFSLSHAFASIPHPTEPSPWAGVGAYRRPAHRAAAAGAR